ncbi:hypothetical protein ABIC28_003537 [Rhodococcus sp. PvR044]
MHGLVDAINLKRIPSNLFPVHPPDRRGSTGACRTDRRRGGSVNRTAGSAAATRWWRSGPGGALGGVVARGRPRGTRSEWRGTRDGSGRVAPRRLGSGSGKSRRGYLKITYSVVLHRVSWITVIIHETRLRYRRSVCPCRRWGSAVGLGRRATDCGGELIRSDDSDASVPGRRSVGTPSSARVRRTRRSGGGARGGGAGVRLRVIHPVRWVFGVCDVLASIRGLSVLVGAARMHFR